MVARDAVRDDRRNADAGRARELIHHHRRRLSAFFFQKFHADVVQLCGGHAGFGLFHHGLQSHGTDVPNGF